MPESQNKKTLQRSYLLFRIFVTGQRKSDTKSLSWHLKKACKNTFRNISLYIFLCLTCFACFPIFSKPIQQKQCKERTLPLFPPRFPQDYRNIKSNPTNKRSHDQSQESSENIERFLIDQQQAFKYHHHQDVENSNVSNHNQINRNHSLSPNQYLNNLNNEQIQVPGRNHSHILVHSESRNSQNTNINSCNGHISSSYSDEEKQFRKLQLSGCSVDTAILSVLSDEEYSQSPKQSKRRSIPSNQSNNTDYSPGPPNINGHGHSGGNRQSGPHDREHLKKMALEQIKLLNHLKTNQLSMNNSLNSQMSTDKNNANKLNYDHMITSNGSDGHNSNQGQLQNQNQISNPLTPDSHFNHMMSMVNMEVSDSESGLEYSPPGQYHKPGISGTQNLNLKQEVSSMSAVHKQPRTMSSSSNQKNFHSVNSMKVNIGDQQVHAHAHMHAQQSDATKLTNAELQNTSSNLNNKTAKLDAEGHNVINRTQARRKPTGSTDQEVNEIIYNEHHTTICPSLNSNIASMYVSIGGTPAAVSPPTSLVQSLNSKVASPGSHLVKRGLVRVMFEICHISVA